MIALRDRNARNGVLLHEKIEARIYEEDVFQAARIAKTREWVASQTQGDIIELCCGTADISGVFANTRGVTGFDCNQKALETAAKRFPSGKFIVADLNEIPELFCDTLILCETLEHLPDPKSVIQKWLPNCYYSVISHPLEEMKLFELGFDLSCGEHQWSYDEDDFSNWFDWGGHRLVKKQVFTMGMYKMILGVGVREDANQNPAG